MAIEQKATVPVRTNGARPARAAPMARWDPFEMLDTMHDEMDRVWNRAWPPRFGLREWWPARLPTPPPAAWAPRMDVYEKDGKLIVKAEVPGIKKEDIQITYDRGDLIIQGERKEEQEVKAEDYYRCERSYGSFFRRLPLPFEAEAEQIQATFADGVLEITVPKPAETKPEATKIDVR